jgi:hypothetical protein
LSSCSKTIWQETTINPTELHTYVAVADPFLLNHCASRIFNSKNNDKDSFLIRLYFTLHIYPSQFLMISIFSCESITNEKLKFEDAKCFGKEASLMVETWIIQQLPEGRRLEFWDLGASPWQGRQRKEVASDGIASDGIASKMVAGLIRCSKWWRRNHHCMEM